MNRSKAVKLISTFTKERTEEKFLDMEYREAEKAKGLGIEAVKEEKGLMEQMVRELKFKQGIAGRQIARFLGMDRNVVQRMKQI